MAASWSSVVLLSAAMFGVLLRGRGEFEGVRDRRDGIDSDDRADQVNDNYLDQCGEMVIGGTPLTAPESFGEANGRSGGQRGGREGEGPTETTGMTPRKPSSPCPESGLLHRPRHSFRPAFPASPPMWAPTGCALFPPDLTIIVLESPAW